MDRILRFRNALIVTIMSYVLILLLVHVGASLNCCLCTNIRCPGVIACCVVISLSRWSYSSVGGHIAQSVVISLSRWSYSSVAGHIAQSLVI